MNRNVSLFIGVIAGLFAVGGVLAATPPSFGTRIDACIATNASSLRFQERLGIRGLGHLRLMRWCFWNEYEREVDAWRQGIFRGYISSSRSSLSASSMSSSRSSVSSQSSMSPGSSTSSMSSASSMSSGSSTSSQSSMSSGSSTSRSSVSSVSSGSSQSSASSQSSSLISVSIRSNKFQPASVTVKQGTTVRWRNDENGNLPHTVTRRFGTSGPLSPVLFPGNTYAFTFTQTGSFPYTCLIHPNMSGSVLVVQ